MSLVAEALSHLGEVVRKRPAHVFVLTDRHREPIAVCFSDAGVREEILRRQAQHLDRVQVFQVPVMRRDL